MQKGYHVLFLFLDILGSLLISEWSWLSVPLIWPTLLKLDQLCYLVKKKENHNDSRRLH